MSRRVLLLMPTTTYKATSFLDAAEALGVEVVVGTDRRQALEQVNPGHTLTLDFGRPERALETILELHGARPLDAVVGADDEVTEIAAMAAFALGRPHNPTASVRTARNKYEARRALRSAGLRGPGFRRVALGESPGTVASSSRYPCVLKPLVLSASRGVLRADDPDQFVAAFERVVEILDRPDVRRKHGSATHLLVEDYMPGGEVALEGLLEAGRLRVLALFDKPDAMEGPTFEETLYVTPSRLPDGTRSAVVAEASAACEGLGLREGPVHAELRVFRGVPSVLEVAPRTIGGLCSRVLRFGAGISLEELVLRHALGFETSGLAREAAAAGVMMIPIPGAGTLAEVRGVDEARAIPGIEEITISLHRGAEVVPLPEGNRYLGFIFARGADPAAVERALRDAHDTLSFTIE